MRQRIDISRSRSRRRSARSTCVRWRTRSGTCSPARRTSRASCARTRRRWGSTAGCWSRSTSCATSGSPTSSCSPSRRGRSQRAAGAAGGGAPGRRPALGRGAGGDRGAAPGPVLPGRQRGTTSTPSAVEPPTATTRRRRAASQQGRDGSRASAGAEPDTPVADRAPADRPDGRRLRLPHRRRAGDARQRRHPAPGDPVRTYRSRRFRLTLGNDRVRLRVNGQVATVPAVTSGIGYEITRAGRRTPPAGERPTCA